MSPRTSTGREPISPTSGGNNAATNSIKAASTIILVALCGHVETCGDARKCVDYIDNNRHRMRYPEFRAMGLCVATGVVEGGCKNIVGSRLKRGGMHWTVSGANAIIALRCAILGNRFDDFWERRANGC